MYMSLNEPVQTDDEMLKPKQVADELQLNIETVYRYIRSQQLRVVRLSAREFRVRRSELNRFLRERETNTGTD
jgi:excisionase family DNA binding protein